MSLFDVFKDYRIAQYVAGAKQYIQENHEPPAPPKPEPKKKTKAANPAPPTISDDKVQYQIRSVPENESPEPETAEKPQVSYSHRTVYNPDMVNATLDRRLFGKKDPNFSTLFEQNLDRTFTEKLIWWIKAKGYRDSAVYKGAHIDRRLFSKIMSDDEYQPSKDTAIALCISLHLNIEDAKDLLGRAGYSLSHSNKRDVVIEYLIQKDVYLLSDVNDTLDTLGMKILGK